MSLLLRAQSHVPTLCVFSSHCSSLEIQTLRLWDVWWPSLASALGAVASSQVELADETDCIVTVFCVSGQARELCLLALGHVRFILGLTSVIISSSYIHHPWMPRKVPDWLLVASQV